MKSNPTNKESNKRNRSFRVKRNGLLLVGVGFFLILGSYFNFWGLGEIRVSQFKPFWAPYYVPFVTGLLILFTGVFSLWISYWIRNKR